VPLSIEPWGISLYPIRDYLYVLDAEDAHGPPQLQASGGAVYTPERDSLVQVTEPISVWLSGSHAVHRVGGQYSGLVWASTHPSEVDSVMSDPHVGSILLHLHDLRTAGRKVHEHEFADLVTPFARSSGRYDIVLLLREHGLIQKKDREILLTEWGAQVSQMAASPSQ
jgi:hypothetical protein